MTQTFVVEAEPRVAQGTGASRRLRRTGKIPAIIYGGNDGPQNITISHNELLKQLKVEAFYAHILTIELEGKNVQAVLKDLQRHPVRDEVYHADFQRVVADQVLRKSVPLHFIGEDVAPGIKLGGGMIEHFINEVEIECLPADLPEFIAVDVSKLALGEVIHLADLSLPQGVTLIELKHDNNIGVVSCHLTKVGKLDEEEAEGDEAAEGDDK
ncbi:MAG: 50S ribosomal protein L25/general stress protein Ctc [Polycyclovorans sp.]|jgi:large subunit ribosomal protein L25|nr:50S ribosomal protein L25/general stress protein Ctc [Polycyclovorans sp.]|tara:strand:+ start:9247 stop:9882 length:636 start_codon:yes stop_codon:yes gene_type:complete